MPDQIHELHMEIRRLKARLFAAENVAALFGWTGVQGDEDDRAAALHELWSQWANHPGVSTDPDDWPWLSDESLAHYANRRRQRRSDVLARLLGEEGDR